MNFFGGIKRQHEFVASVNVVQDSVDYSAVKDTKWIPWHSRCLHNQSIIDLRRAGFRIEPPEGFPESNPLMEFMNKQPA